MINKKKCFRFFQKFINAIAKGVIYCPRIHLFRVQEWRALRHISCNLWMLNDETVRMLLEYIHVSKIYFHLLSHSINYALWETVCYLVVQKISFEGSISFYQSSRLIIKLHPFLTISVRSVNLQCVMDVPPQNFIQRYLVLQMTCRLTWPRFLSRIVHCLWDHISKCHPS